MVEENKLKTLKDLREDSPIQDNGIRKLNELLGRMQEYLQERPFNDSLEYCHDTDDMRERFREFTKNSDFYGLISVEELREAAIGWIKELQMRMSYQEHSYNQKHSLIHTVDWIKFFFNITEEELREEKKRCGATPEEVKT